MIIWGLKGWLSLMIFDYLWFMVMGVFSWSYGVLMVDDVCELCGWWSLCLCFQFPWLYLVIYGIWMIIDHQPATTAVHWWIDHLPWITGPSLVSWRPVGPSPSACHAVRSASGSRKCRTQPLTCSPNRRRAFAAMGDAKQQTRQVN